MDTQSYCFRPFEGVLDCDVQWTIRIELWCCDANDWLHVFRCDAESCTCADHMEAFCGNVAVQFHHKVHWWIGHIEETVNGTVDVIHSDSLDFLYSEIQNLLIHFIYWPNIIPNNIPSVAFTVTLREMPWCTTVTSREQVNSLGVETDAVSLSRNTICCGDLDGRFSMVNVPQECSWTAEMFPGWLPFPSNVTDNRWFVALMTMLQPLLQFCLFTKTSKVVSMSKGVDTNTAILFTGTASWTAINFG